MTNNSEPAREAVARIIDPKSWEAYDHAYSMQVGEFRRFADRVVKPSLATAGAVIEHLSASPAPAASGGLEAVRELIEAACVERRNDLFRMPPMRDGLPQIGYRTRELSRIDVAALQGAFDMGAKFVLDLVAALAAPAATGGEAVAWRWRSKSEDEWNFAPDAIKARMMAGTNGEIEALGRLL